ncbi:MAG: tetratricopeptide repeat protein [Alphaproteobacteria bacterium]
MIQARQLVEAGIAHYDAGRMAKAQQAYGAALKVVPGHPRALHLLGVIAHKTGRPGAAVKFISQAIKRRPRVAVFHNNLGNALRQLGKREASLVAYKRAIALAPKMAEAYTNLGIAYFELGQIDESLAAHGQALALKPDSVLAKWNTRLTLPALYDSKAAIDRHRKRWSEGVKALTDDLDLSTPAKAAEAELAVTLMTNFYLNYQGRNDVALQKLYGGLLDRISSAAYPKVPATLEPQVIGPGERIRVGFVSFFLYHHSVYKTHGAWITGLDKSRFEVHVLYTGRRFDAATENVKRNADAFHNNLHSNRQRIAMIRESKLDVLIYLDIGMHPDMQLMGALRLAPVQCLAGGHPVTSGLPTMDYFLSSELMEPKGAQAHYTEKLVNLPNLANCYPLPEVPEIEPQTGRKAVVYLCSQSLFKLLPQYDKLFVRIAEQVPNSNFWFVADRARPVTEQFRARLAKAFGRANLDFDGRVVIQDRRPHAEFLALNCQADVLLDSILWSGHNSTFDAMACGLPVVTLPGPMMRARHTYAILTMMGIDETIASDEDDYVAIAVRFGKDGRFR